MTAQHAPPPPPPSHAFDMGRPPSSSNHHHHPHNPYSSVDFGYGAGASDRGYGGADRYTPNGIALPPHGFGDAMSGGPPPPRSLSPRSMMQQQQHQQQQQWLGGPPPAQNLGSGLMSNSGLPAEEITTVFIVGFPDDMTEREFANMFLFARGFEASTLKIPSGSGLGPSSNGQRGGDMGPYHPVSMPNSNPYDMASSGGWDEHSINAALGRSDPFTLAGLGGALGAPGSDRASAAAKIKQTIGFAKFRTRAEALEARDALNGKKIDAERGCVLKTEMAKKNLHTKRAAGPEGPGELRDPRDPRGAQPQSWGSSFEAPPMPQPPPPPLLQQAPPPPLLAPRGPPSLSGLVSPGSEGFGGRTRADTAATSASTSRTTPGERWGDVAATTSTSTDRWEAARSQKWTSLGPLDYFGPPSASDEPTPAPAPAAATRQTREGSGGSAGHMPRGPDWSAIGSPPGLFATAKPFVASGATAAASAAASQASAQAPAPAPAPAPALASTAAPFKPAGEGEKSNEGAKPKAADATTSSSSANADPTTPSASNISTSISPPAPASTAFASRFGSLRLDSSASADAATPAANPSSSSTASTSPKSPTELSSPTSRSFSIDQNPPGTTLFVGNLPGSISASASASLEDQLRQRFLACQGYRQLSYRVKNNGPMCFVEFDDVQNAARALAEVNGDTMGGAVKNGGLRLSFSKNPLFRNSSTGTGATVGGNVVVAPATPASPTLAARSTNSFASLGKVSESLHDEDLLGDALDSANNLEDSSFRDGFSAGHAHGKLHGTFEGRALGREKGFELWDEVGFYEGTARFWRGVLAKQVESLPVSQRSRKQVKQLQHLEALETLIAAFPTKNRSGAAVGGDDNDQSTSAGSVSGEGGVEDAETLSKMDMSALLERIRARYKVVCASLGIPARGLEERTTASAPQDSSPSSPSSPSSTAATTTTSTAQTVVAGGKTVDPNQLRF